jgi:hypothetical protein
MPVLVAARKPAGIIQREFVPRSTACTAAYQLA